PKHLSDEPALQEFYGHLGYASRAYFAGTLGWFDGNPTSLGKLPPDAEAKRIVALAGGEAKIIEAAQKAFSDGDLQWAIELADHLIVLKVELDTAIQVKKSALRNLADQTVNAPTRNYYLLSARELEQT
ncbi:MAG: alkyl sulfatase dimerization domain-containing protein, partial [Pseudomonadota bacterium]